MKKSLGAKALIYTTPVWLVGTYDKTGKPNIMAASWAGICCSKPPAVYVSLRKATYTHGNIMEKKAWTLNVPSEKFVKEADYCGIVSGNKEDKFKACGFTSVRSDLVDAPYIKEFPLVLECRLIKAVEIGLHTEFIGEVMDVKAEEGVLGNDGLPDIEKVRPFMFCPEAHKYYGIGKYIGEAFSIGRK